MNQMQKTGAMLLGLLVVCGAVGLFAWKGIYEPDAKKADQKAQDERLFATSSSAREKDAGSAKVDFVKLTVRSGSDVTVLERTPPEPWRITTPVAAKVDPLVVDALVSQLQTSRFKTTLEGDATDDELKTYGLDNPGFVVEAEAVVDGAPKSVKLEGGIENPFDGTIYMRKDGSRTVHMAEGGARWAFAKTTFDLRDKEVFVVDDSKLEKVAVKTSSNDWELVRGDDKLWRMTRPEAVQADATTVTAMLGTFRGERAISFPADSTTLSSLGFDAPKVTATFTVGGKAITFKLAQNTGDAAKVYVTREDESGRLLAEVGSQALTALDRNPIDLRDKSLIPFSKQLVVKVSLKSPEAETVVEKESVDASVEGWRVTAPTPGPAKAYKVATTLWTLSSLKTGTTVTEKADAKSLELYGLDPKNARVVTIFGANGVLATLKIGKEVVGKAGSAYGVGTRGAIVEFDGSHLKDLPWNGADLLDVPAAADAGSP